MHMYLYKVKKDYLLWNSLKQVERGQQKKVTRCKQKYTILKYSGTLDSYSNDKEELQL